MYSAVLGPPLCPFAKYCNAESSKYLAHTLPMRKTLLELASAACMYLVQTVMRPPILFIEFVMCTLIAAGTR